MWRGGKEAVLKVFTSTETAIDGAAVSLPAPLSAEDAQRVPGVLGQVTAERVAAYAAATLPQLPEEGRLRSSFAAALSLPGLQIIAEVKRKSPSLGAIADLDPVEAARAYAEGGAAALSVLTEPNHFGGELSHLTDVAAQVALPLLRKDFTVHPAQLYEAKIAGASAVLLIVAVLGEKLTGYLELSDALGLDALVEVHDEAELELALGSGAKLIGVNNRDLKTLAIDLATSPRLMATARAAGFGGLLVAESGYRRASDLESVRPLADAVLIGSSVAGSGDLAGAVRTLRHDLEAWGRDA
jgi:indole-3-glycerol phosphate synthase